MLKLLNRKKLVFYVRKYGVLREISDPLRASTVAITEPDGITYTYGDLAISSSLLASKIRSCADDPIKTVASFNPPGANYVITALASWKLGAKFVPLSQVHTIKELSYFIEDSGSEIIVCSECSVQKNSKKLQDLKKPKLVINANQMRHQPVHDVFPIVNDPEEEAIVLYTSGTTGRPKGVVHTHKGVFHMVSSLVTAWKYTSSDKILHFLPLHHMHGLVNKLLCVLYAGGEVEFLGSTAPGIWDRLSEEGKIDFQAEKDLKPVSLFMAVPTVYSKLLGTANEIISDKHDSLKPQDLVDALDAIKEMRLMVSGSAALPDPVMNAWEKLTGHTLLERYGMSELGMALSNPLQGERVVGSVGRPLPFVSCRVVDDKNKEVYGPNQKTIPNDGELIGELRVKGPTVFKEYLKKPHETAKSFDEDGWFRTGDIVQVVKGNGPSADGIDDVIYRILGRDSTDIIKFGGYKLSALEIERELLSFEKIAEACVVGVKDEEYGQIPEAIIVLKPIYVIDAMTIMQELDTFLNERLAPYKQPHAIHSVEFIPKNHLGKVNKKTVLVDVGVLDEHESN